MDLNSSLEGIESDEEVAKAIIKVEREKKQKEENIKIQREENHNFLKTILKYVKLDQNSSFHHDIHSLDFSKISEDLNGMPIKECRKKLQLLLKPLTLEKSLHQLLTETYKNVIKSHIGKPKGYNVFLILNAKRIKDELREKKLRLGGLHSYASSLWGKLTEKEKLTYEGIKACGKTPIDLYHETLRKDNTNLTLKQVKRLWDMQEMSEREIFIKKSTELKMGLMEKNIEGFDMVLGPNERELSDYLAAHGMPEKPSMSLNLCYLRKIGEYDSKLPITKLNVLAAQKFHALTKEERAIFKHKHEKSVRKYEKLLKRWEYSLDEVERFMLKIFRENGNGKSSSEMSKTKPLEEYNTILMPLIRMKFEMSTSDIFPITPVQVYRHEKKEKKGKVLSHLEALKCVTKLDKIKKTALEAKAKKNKNDFVKKLINYTKSLSEEHRRIFLGQHRFRFMNELKEDVFQNDFPDSEYPVYIRQKQYNRTNNNKKTKEEDLTENHSVAKSSKKLIKRNLCKEMGSSISEILDDIDFNDLPVKTEETSNGMHISSNKSKRKRNNSSSSSKKRRKLNEDEDHSMVKMDPDSDDAEEYGDLYNLQKYMNSLQFESEDIKFDAFVKEEHEI